MASETIPTLRPLARTAAQDLLGGLIKWRVVGRLGWLDIKRRYRRTVIGPFWSTVSLALFVGALGSIGVGLWKQSASEYIPFLAAGLVVWVMLSTIVTEACTLLISGQNLFRQMRFDYSALAYALVWRNFVVFMHNLLVYLICVAIFKPSLLTWTAPLAIPGLALVMLNAVWIALFLGLLCLRFRDLQQLITNLITIAIFITPIFWPPDVLAGTHRFVFVTFNPVYHLIEVVRAPLVAKVPTLETYLAMLIITVVGWGMTYAFFNRFRRRIAYWS
jgi:ABC-type polysaccharide/polyol phosphate export permease